MAFLLTKFTATLSFTSPLRPTRFLHSHSGTNDNFSRMLKQLETVFKKAEVRTRDVRKVLKAYKSHETEWERFCFFEKDKYTRNLVFSDDRFSAIILCWQPGQESSIHDHSNAHCWVKILQGELTETRFKSEEDVRDKDKMEKVRSGSVRRNAVTYMHDTLGFHLMANTSKDQTVTLHIYSPTFSQCNTFDKITGEKCVSTMTFSTINGKKVD